MSFLEAAHSVILLGWRNMWRNYRRTLIMLAAISVSLWAMVVLNSLFRGMVDDMFGRGIAAMPGHVQIFHPAYRDDPNIANRIRMPEGALLERLGQEDVAKWVARIRVNAVITSERDFRGVQLVGIDPGREDLAELGLELSEGENLGASGKGVVIGQALADRLQTSLGRKLVLSSQGAEDPLAERGVRITGIYRAELKSQEEREVYATLPLVRSLLQLGDEATVVAAFAADESQHNELAAGLRAAAGSGLLVQSWTLTDPFLDSMVTVTDGYIYVFVIIVFLVLSFGLANTLAMSIFERVREIGLMLALGFRPALIFFQLVAETSCLLLLGLALGNALWAATVWAIGSGFDISIVAEGLDDFGMGTLLYPVVLFEDVAKANGLVLVLGILTSILPALRATRSNPLAALNTAA